MKKSERSGVIFLFVFVGIIVCTGDSAAASIRPSTLPDILRRPPPPACRFEFPLPEKTCPGVSSAIEERQTVFWHHLVRALCVRPRPTADFYVIDFSCDAVHIIVAGVTTEQKGKILKIDLLVYESLAMAAYEATAVSVAEKIRHTYSDDRPVCPFSVAAIAPSCESSKMMQKYELHCRMAALLVRGLCTYPYPHLGVIRISFQGDRIVVDIGDRSFSRRLSIPVNRSGEKLSLHVKQGAAAIRFVLDFLAPEQP